MSDTSDTDARGCTDYPKGAQTIIRAPSSFYRAYGKRMIDIIGASLSLVVFLPLLVLLLMVVSLEGANPLFGHKRVGRHGRIFRCWKIRSMVPDAEQRLNAVLETDPEARREWAESRKLKYDPRITKFGNFLRRSSLDELPQFWNVLVGDMSIVGPRPVTSNELRFYGHADGLYMSLRPGLTGPWQIGGRGKVSYDARVQMDTHYHLNISALRDMEIVLRTPSVIFKGTGS